MIDKQNIEDDIIIDRKEYNQYHRTYQKERYNTDPKFREKKRQESRKRYYKNKVKKKD